MGRRICRSIGCNRRLGRRRSHSGQRRNQRDCQRHSALDLYINEFLLLRRLRRFVFSIAILSSGGVKRYIFRVTLTVWIVQHDESPDNTILGVFATSEAAAEFAEQVKDGFSDGVVFAGYDVPYRFNTGLGHASYGPVDT